MLEKHVHRQVTAYCHRELTAAESSRVQQHLEVCKPCRREYDNIRLAVDLTSQISLQRVPDSLWGEVVRGLDDARAAMPGKPAVGIRPAWSRWAFTVAALVLVSALGASW